MKHHSLRITFLILFVIFLLTAVFTAVAVAQDDARPEAQPNAAAAQGIYLERCANCHGAEGAGDGELAINLPRPPQALNDPDYRRTAVPNVMYDWISNGNMNAEEGIMPAFGSESSNPIAALDRWHLVALVYSFSTPAEAIAAGETVYEENCLACHGATGLGDGPEAADLSGPNLDLTRFSYWAERSNEMVYTALESGAVPEHEYDLSDADRWAVVDYGRTFSYDFVDLFAPAQPLETAVVTGQVSNGSTRQPFSGGYVRLRGFTVDFEEMLNITTTIDATGAYTFTLTDVPADLVFLSSVPYNDLSFSSDAGQLTAAQPELDLPVTVYETTTSPVAILVEQVHFIVEFVSEDLLEVSQLYVFSNLSDGVFIGESGDMDEGTIRLGLPPNAQVIGFERTFGSFENTLPAMEVIETGANAWADTLPVRPGQGTANLIVRYQLPYEDGMEITHPVYYNVERASFIVPDVGVSVAGDDWQFDGAQQMPGGPSFLSYSRAGLDADAALAVTLSGQPSAPTASSGGNVAAPRDSTQDLLIGGGLLLIVLSGAGLYIYTQRQTAAEAYDEYDEDDYDEYDHDTYDAAARESLTAEIDTAAAASAGDRDQLLQAIADLDDAYAAGELQEADYNSQRAQLKEQLKGLWN